MRALRVLLVEDSPEDAVLVVRFLARGPFQVQHTRVQDAAALKAALAEQRFDIVLCDFELPSLDAFEALAIVRGHDETLPLIVVSGRIGEDVAVETVRRGANDYLLKSNLTRLPVAVERALDEAEQKRERAAVREQLVVAERMATVGSLAAGLVHEINNPLSSLLFNLEYMADSLARVGRKRRVTAEVQDCKAAGGGARGLQAGDGDCGRREDVRPAGGAAAPGGVAGRGGGIGGPAGAGGDAPAGALRAGVRRRAAGEG